MRKVLLSFFIGCVGFIPCYASTFFSLDGGKGGKSNTTHNGDFDPFTDTRPHEPMADYQFIKYDPDSAVLTINLLGFTGPVFVSLANPAEGMFSVFFVDSSTRIVDVPFTEGPGIWELRVFSTRNAFGDCNCFFYLENGIIIRM